MTNKVYFLEVNEYLITYKAQPAEQVVNAWDVICQSVLHPIQNNEDAYSLLVPLRQNIHIFTDNPKHHLIRTAAD